MKKGQAALEFLMTYGWAILVVLIVIGALAYFGVLNPNTFVGERCNLPAPLVCSNSVVKLNGAAVNTAIFSITNAGGSEIQITSMLVNQTGSGSTTSWCNNAAVATKIKNGESATITVTCAADPTFIDVGRSSKAKFNLAVSYYATESGATFTKTVYGDMVSTLSP